MSYPARAEGLINRVNAYIKFIEVCIQSIKFYSTNIYVCIYTKVNQKFCNILVHASWQHKYHMTKVLQALESMHFD